MALDGSTKWTSTQLWVIAEICKQFFRRLRQFDADALIFKLPSKTGKHQIDHLNNLFFGEFVEHDGLVDAVKELWAEVLLESVVDLFLHALVRHC